MMVLIDRLILFLTLSLFSVMTVLDGARSEIVSGFFFIAFESLLLAWLVVCWRHPRFSIVIRKFWWLWIVLSGWLIYGYFQTFSLLGLETIDPYASYQQMAIYTGYCGTLMLMLLLLRNVQRIRLAIFVILGVALVQTVFGMINYYGQGPVLGWTPTHYSSIRVTGSYVNRNFYANLILLSFGFALVPLIYSRSRATVPGYPRSGAESILFICISIVLLAGLFLSGSRAGTVVLAASLGMIILLALYDSRSRLALGSLLVVAVTTIILFGTGVLSGRMAVLSQGGQARIAQWVPTLQVSKEKWLTGYGPGTYEAAFKTRTSGELGPMTFNHAHNDYLELLINQGMLGGLFLGSVAVIIFGKLLWRSVHCRSRTRKRFLLASIFGISSMHLHAMLDFPFQVPANTVVYLVITAIGLSATIMRMPGRTNHKGADSEHNRY